MSNSRSETYNGDIICHYQQFWYISKLLGVVREPRDAHSISIVNLTIYEA